MPCGSNSTPIGMPVIARQPLRIFRDVIGHSFYGVLVKMQIDALNESAERAAEFLRSVAHPGRLRIVCALMDAELSATQLARHARLPAPALSQQAAILEAEGLIGRRRDGRSVFYRLESPQVKPLAKLLYRLFCKPAQATPGRRARKKESPRE
jgi:DNA-binding transcriptional ArsR family regulator